METAADCDQFLIQLNAAKAALERIGMLVVTRNLRRCLAEKVEGDVVALDDLEDVLSGFVRHVDNLKAK